MHGWIEPALRPLRHYADFRGRSTRTEVIAFYLLTSFVTMAFTILFGIFSPFDFRGEWVAGQIVQFLFLCPTLALSVRRFHDHGRSGWWLLVALPVLGANLWKSYWTVFSMDRFAGLYHDLPWLAEGAALLCVLTYLGLLFWEDEEGTNRYGPNPRYDEPQPEQPSAAAGLPAAP